ncbi:MAG: tRNA (adenosine(37)-N6)-dimethylallyltransferase MiaA [Pseudomonadota bacterium]
MSNNIVLIAGPTASGKSAKALELACERNARIINCDSMQVYSTLRVVTARPSDDDHGTVPHDLYGHVHPSQDYSTAVWLEDVRSVMTGAGDQPLIFVGGTGLYFKALCEGLSAIPPIPAQVRDRVRYRIGEEGAPKLHRLLRSIDPMLAMQIKPGDTQRVARAIEVFEATGKTLSWWHSQKAKPLIDANAAEKFILEPSRAVLHQRINSRVEKMLNEGAIDEVQKITALGLSPDKPAMKAIGVPEIANYLSGEMSKPALIDQMQAHTRQYAKRQSTWWRNQMGPDWQRISA